MATRVDPYRNFRFRVEFGGIQVAGFQECAFADTSIEVVEYREGTDITTHPRKLSGQTKYGDVTLKWGITDNTDLYDWFVRVLDKGAEGNRDNIAITLVDEAGNDKSRWELENCWPKKYDPTDFNAKGNDLAIETMEICTESYRRVA